MIKLILMLLLITPTAHAYEFPLVMLKAGGDYYILTDACGEIVRGLAPTPILYCKEEIEKKKSKYVGEFEAHKVRLVPVNDD